MNNPRRGHSYIEWIGLSAMVGIGLYLLFWIGIAVSIVWAAAHFILKYW
jgi:hypothetical protein